VSDQVFYLCSILPVFAALLNKDAVKYCALIMIASLAFDYAMSSASDDWYFLAAAILDIVLIFCLPKIAAPLAIYAALNAVQFLFGSIWAQTGNFYHFYAVTIVQFIYLVRLNKGGGGVGFSNIHDKIIGFCKPYFVGRKRVDLCKTKK
jgi:hypothetical protein